MVLLETINAILATFVLVTSLIEYELAYFPSFYEIDRNKIFLNNFVYVFCENFAPNLVNYFNYIKFYLRTI